MNYLPDASLRLLCLSTLYFTLLDDLQTNIYIYIYWAASSTQSPRMEHDFHVKSEGEDFSIPK